MQVKILHFAQIRELCGVTEEYIQCQTNNTVLDAWRIITNRHTELRQLAYRPLPALNGHYAEWNTFMSAGDELVFLSPMSGG
jgi:molybdopterin converting factor small subunit